MISQSPKPAGFCLVSLVTGANVLIAAAFAASGLIATSAVPPETVGLPSAASVYALYAAARALPLALIVLVAVIRKNVTALAWLGALAGIVQVLDAGGGVMQHDTGKIVGPLVIAALQVVALVRLHRSAAMAPMARAS